MPGVTSIAGLEVAAELQLGSHVAEVSWAPDSARVAAATDAGPVLVGGVDGAVDQVAEHALGALSVEWSTAGVVASGGRDGRVVIGGVAHRAGGRWVERVRWRPDGARLAVAHDRVVQFLGADGGLLAESAALPAAVTDLAWHPKGVEVGAATYGGVRLLRADGRVAKHLPWKGSVLSLAFSDDGRRLAHGNQDASVHFWDLRRASELEMWGYATKVRELDWSAGSRWLATGGGSGVACWDFSRPGGPAGSEPRELIGHAGRVTAVRFARSSGLLASGATDHTVVVWAPDRDARPVAVGGVLGPVSALAWSPDGRLLAVGQADGTLSILEAPTV